MNKILGAENLEDYASLFSNLGSRACVYLSSKSVFIVK